MLLKPGISSCEEGALKLTGSIEIAELSDAVRKLPELPLVLCFLESGWEKKNGKAEEQSEILILLGDSP